MPPPNALRSHAAQHAVTLSAQLLAIAPKAWEQKLPQPSSIMAIDVRVLSTRSYRVAIKHDGERRLFVLGATAAPDSGEAIAFGALISRRGAATCVHSALCAREAWPPHPAFVGTLVDGELMSNGTFVAFDAYSYHGYSLTALALDERLERLRAFAREWNEVIAPTPSPVHIVPKQFLHATAENVERAWREGCADGADGIVFVDAEDAVYLGRHPTYFKHKPLAHVTVDLMYDGERFSCSNREALPPDIAPPAGNATFTRGVYECGFERHDGGARLCVRMRRHDKSTANAYFVVDRTLRNFCEPIDIADIACAANIGVTLADPGVRCDK